ncbi:MAG: hypothetical protein KAW89_10245 [Armatimonadetes bacterium]|nr:hypothetical protein [Armatimonadota bacterium]
MTKVLVVEDNEKLRKALTAGLEATGEVSVIYDCARGEEALGHCLEQQQPDDILMDVQLAGQLYPCDSLIA